MDTQHQRNPQNEIQMFIPSLIKERNSQYIGDQWLKAIHSRG